MKVDMRQITKEFFDGSVSTSLPAEKEFRERLLHTPLAYQMTLNEAMLNEGFTKDLLKDAIQYLASSGAEYGIGGITLPAAGAGIAIGPAVETMVDSAFAAEEIASTIGAVSNFGSKMAEFSPLWDEAVNAWTGDVESYYKQLVVIIRKGLELLGAQAGSTVEALADKLKIGVEKIISSMINALEQGIKLIIPDATLGLAAAKGFEQVMNVLAENSYTLTAAVISKIKILKDFIQDPSVAIAFFEDVFKQVIELIRKAAVKVQDLGWAGMLALTATAGPVATLVFKKFGPDGLKKAGDLIEEKLPSVMEVIEQVLTIMVPTALTALGVFQVLMSEDYKKEATAGGDVNVGITEEGVQWVTPAMLQYMIREGLS